MKTSESKKNVTISVLMGVYYRKNDVSLLKRAVTSILDQSESGFELIICDDGSSDEAKKYLDSAARDDERVKLIRNGALFSLPQKLNACLSKANGEFIARMDDDDYSHPDRFKAQLDYLRSNPEIGFCGCNVNLIRDGNIVGSRVFPQLPNVQDFYFVQPFIHPSLMFRRDKLELVNGYSEENSCILCEDYDLLLRLYAAGCKGANLQRIYFDYTVPLTAKGSRKMRHRLNESITRYKRFKQLGVLPKALPYVIKPILVGLLPEKLLANLKKKRDR